MSRETPERAGLDYLYQAGKVSPELASQAPLGPVHAFEVGVQAYAPRTVLQAILRHEESTGEKSVRLKEIAKEVEMGPEVLLPMIKRLQQAGLVVTLEEEWGNDLVALSSRGRELSESSDDVALLRALSF